MSVYKISIIIIALAGLVLVALPSSAADQQGKGVKHVKDLSRPPENSPNVATSVFEKVSNSVVIVEAQTPDGKARGSGVVYSSKSRAEYLTWEGEQPVVREGPISYVVTNAHVVNNADRVFIFHHGARYKATVEWADDEFDLASLLVPEAALPATLPYSAVQLKVGEMVFAIGSPLGLESLENTISQGIISGKRQKNGVVFLQTTAPISHGNSGGGLFDAKGRFVGVTSFKVVGGENVNFAIDAGIIASISDTARNRKEAKDSFKKGDALMEVRKYREAIEAYSGTIERDPKNAAAYYKRGVAYHELRDYDQAMKDYGKVIELKPEKTEAYVNRGSIYYRLGKDSQAMEDFNKAIRIDPRDSYAYHNRGSLYYDLGDYSQAIRDYDRAIELDPRDALAYRHRGNAYAKIGNRRQALEDQKNAARLGDTQLQNLLRSEGIEW